MHKLLIATLLLFTACTTTAPVQPKNYRLNEIDTPSGKPLKVNDFYSVYYVYMNVIRTLELDSIMSRDEVEHVITRVIDSLKHGQGIQIVIPHYNGGPALRCTLRTDLMISKQKAPNLLLVSNYNTTTQRTVEGDAQKDAYATYFLIAGNKLIKHQYFDDPKSQMELRAMSINNLAEYYLLDGDDANDQLGQVMLEKSLPNAKDPVQAFLMHLTLSEFYLLDGKLSQARNQLSQAQGLVAAQSQLRDRQRMSHLYSYASDLVYYYEKYHH